MPRHIRRHDPQHEHYEGLRTIPLQYAALTTEVGQGPNMRSEAQVNAECGESLLVQQRRELFSVSNNEFSPTENVSRVQSDVE